MKATIVLFFLCFFYVVSVAQPLDYLPFATKQNELLHTKLVASFDCKHQTMQGQVWLLCKPYFYATDSLVLDTKVMELLKVGMVRHDKIIPLSYKQNDWHTVIHLDKSYTSQEPYTIYISYIAHPDSVSKIYDVSKAKKRKGLYFINPLGTNKQLPTEIWTQGESENTSVWVPTIDQPNQKCTTDFYFTFPDTMVCLSNGVLVKEEKHGKTKTDEWRMDKPIQPYVFFVGIGKFAIVKDSYRHKEVNYYVDPLYQSVAKRIFGLTPDMMQYFSSILQYEYPWNKYDQMIAHNYVEGAMENTTCTLHDDRAQQNARQLVEGNRWEEVISHELFHQWFGDLVTCVDWSNLTVNESFADYGESLWLRHHAGNDAADEHLLDNAQTYLSNPDNYAKNLVRNQYKDIDDVFDAVTYSKGGCILHMLHTYLGDTAFFQSLHNYLVTNKYGYGDAIKLKQAFESTIGQELSWFWREWYFGHGHPILDITYSYDPQKQLATAIVKQVQTIAPLFTMPIAIDVYIHGNYTRYNVWIKDSVDTFNFVANQQPDLINFDATKTLLCQKTENKDLNNYIFQYQHAKVFIDRYDAIVFATKYLSNPIAFNFLSDIAIHDSSSSLKEIVLNSLKDTTVSSSVLHTAFNITNDTKELPLVRALAMQLLEQSPQSKDYIAIYKRDIFDSSYTIAGIALLGLYKADSSSALLYLPTLKKDAMGLLKNVITEINNKKQSKVNKEAPLTESDQINYFRKKFATLQQIAVNILNTTNDLLAFRTGIDTISMFIAELINQYPEVGPIADLLLNKIKNYLIDQQANKNAPVFLKDEIDYVNVVLKKFTN